MPSEFQPFHYKSEESIDLTRMSMIFLTVLGIVVISVKLFSDPQLMIPLVFLIGGCILLFKYNHIRQSV